MHPTQQQFLHLRKKVLVWLRFRLFLLTSDLGFQLELCQHYLLFFKSVMFLSEHGRQIMFEKYEISPACGELRAKILSRFLQNCVFSPPSKSFLRLSAISIRLPHCKQTEFFEFGVRDSLQNDLVGVEPAASIRRLTAVCYYARSSRHAFSTYFTGR